MRTYGYFPGCSAESLGLSYHLSALECVRALGGELKELENWSCCGTSTYFHVDELLAHVLVARNLAIAERTGLDFVATCSGCYKNAYFTNKQLQKDPELGEHINFALAADDLHLDGTVKVRHLMEVFLEDFGLEEIRRHVTRPLEGVRIAPYYGCQLVRPQKEDENVEWPMFFEDLMRAIGGTPVDYATKMRCCGSSLMISNRDAALDMVHRLIQDAADRETDVIATICPLCQINLEVYQKQANREYGTNYSIPVLYFTQLMGLALGIAPGRLGIGKELISADNLLFFTPSEQAAG
jgi:heterodisulfide reductase subunit B2